MKDESDSEYCYAIAKCVTSERQCKSSSKLFFYWNVCFSNFRQSKTKMQYLYNLLYLHYPEIRTTFYTVIFGHVVDFRGVRGEIVFICTKHPFTGLVDWAIHFPVTIRLIDPIPIPVSAKAKLSSQSFRNFFS